MLLIGSTTAHVRFVFEFLNLNRPTHIYLCLNLKIDASISFFLIKNIFLQITITNTRNTLLEIRKLESSHLKNKNTQIDMNKLTEFKYCFKNKFCRTYEHTKKFQRNLSI